MRRGIGYQSLLDEMMSRCVFFFFFFLITRFYSVSRLRSVGKTGIHTYIHTYIVYLVTQVTEYARLKS